MSIKVMTMVFDRYPAGGNERLLALAMADHARDDGTRIWPSITELAHKTLQSRSTVQRQVRKMLEAGWLVLVHQASGRRGDTNEYRICPHWIAGGPVGGGELAMVNLTPHDAGQIEKSSGDEIGVDPVDKLSTRVSPATRGVSPDTLSVVTAVTPESSRTVINRNTPLPPKGGERAFEDLWARYPRHESRAAALRWWKRKQPDTALQGQITAAVEAMKRSARWMEQGGKFVPRLDKWLRGECWLDEGAGQAVVDWWRSVDGVKDMGLRLGLGAFSLAPLGNGYTDDEKSAHWRAYRARVFDAAGDGVWHGVSGRQCSQKNQGEGYAHAR